MQSKDNIGDRMKKFYEDTYRFHLPMRLPIIIRLDACHFHTYTKKCKRPVDHGLVHVMNETAKYLCKNIQGAQIGYVQSDEISILLNNYQTLNTEAWFDNNLQKMVSVSASMAGAFFTANSWRIFRPEKDIYPMGTDALDTIKIATFDSRAFVMPKEEVNNYFIFRQQDATRNSVQMLARSLCSHKECTDKNNSELQNMLLEKGINWNDCPTSQKRGRCIIKSKLMKQGTNPKTGETFAAERSEWAVDNEIPIFSQNREYINQYVFPADDEATE
jgi:tRNA(His) guanylyltransferase